MDLVTPVPTASSVTVFSTPVASPSRLALIAMLLARGEVTHGDAERLAMDSAALDEMMMLASLHDRRDLADVAYQCEKGELLRRLRRLPL